MFVGGRIKAHQAAWSPGSWHIMDTSGQKKDKCMSGTKRMVDKGKNKNDEHYRYIYIYNLIEIKGTIYNGK